MYFGLVKQVRKNKLTFLYICLCFAFHRTCVLDLKYFLDSESFFLNWNNYFAIPSRTVYPFPWEDKPHFFLYMLCILNFSTYK